MSRRRSFLKVLAAASLFPARARAKPFLLASGAGGPAGAKVGGGAPPAGKTPDKLVMLGTQGGPQYTLIRGETASALIINDQPYLIDCGYGTFRALNQAGINFLKIARVFLTHLHDDHTADLPAFLGHQLTRGRTEPTTVYGPHATDELVTAIVAVNTPSARIRQADEGRKVLPAALFKSVVVPAKDVPTKVYEDGQVVVTSVENTHYSDSFRKSMPDRSLAYRFDTPTRSVVFSGDTAYSDKVVRLAKNADIFVCETMDTVATRKAFDAQVAKGAYHDNPEGVWNHIVASHSPCKDAGRMAAEAKVKTLVLNHLVPGGLNPHHVDSSYVDQISPHFSGKIIVAADQMVL